MAFGLGQSVLLILAHLAAISAPCWMPICVHNIKPMLDNAENKQKKGRGGQRKFKRCCAAFISYQSWSASLQSHG